MRLYSYILIHLNTGPVHIRAQLWGHHVDKPWYSFNYHNDITSWSLITLPYLTILSLGGRPDLVVMGDDSWSRGRGFESLCSKLDGIDIFSHWFVANNVPYRCQNVFNAKLYCAKSTFWNSIQKIILFIRLFNLLSFPNCKQK